MLTTYKCDYKIKTTQQSTINKKEKQHAYLFVVTYTFIKSIVVVRVTSLIGNTKIQFQLAIKQHRQNNTKFILKLVKYLVLYLYYGDGNTNTAQCNSMIGHEISKRCYTAVFVWRRRSNSYVLHPNCYYFCVTSAAYYSVNHTIWGTATAYGD